MSSVQKPYMDAGFFFFSGTESKIPKRHTLVFLALGTLLGSSARIERDYYAAGRAAGDCTGKKFAARIGTGRLADGACADG
ncbi:MAG: hypothetical protein Q7S58_07770, partial [Candidatus Binatus sp.]|uniref:hypothetical protein n=1 Tax=Candidatus Binatus sp. TaxID=2811406 RepID=UPI00271BB08E